MIGWPACQLWQTAADQGKDALEHADGDTGDRFGPSTHQFSISFFGSKKSGDATSDGFRARLPEWPDNRDTLAWMP